MSLGGSTGGPGVEQTDLRERTGATLLSGRPRLSMGCGGEIQMLKTEALRLLLSQPLTN